MKHKPIIQLICRTSENRTVIVYENKCMQIVQESFLAFVERFCNHAGTSIACNQSLQKKHFNYHKNTPLYLGAHNHLTLVPSCSLKNTESFLYNAHQILRMEDLGGSTAIEFIDGTCYEINVGYRSLRSQVKRANEVRAFYQKSYPFMM